MKKILLLLLLFIGMIGCDEEQMKQDSIRRQESELKTYTYDSCEYVGRGLDYNNAVLTHKGNCKNVIHYKQK